MNLKMKKRRVRDFLVAGSLILGMMLTGCGMSGQQTEQNGGKEQNKVENKKISVVATIFPQYDFVRQIAGENVELKMLLKPGEETHSYEPTPQDIIAIQNSDLFIYVGGENDAWVEDILESMPDNGRKTLKLVDCVDTVEEEHVEGMKEERGHDHDEDDAEHEEHEVEHEEDEADHEEHGIHATDSMERPSNSSSGLRDLRRADTSRCSCLNCLGDMPLSRTQNFTRSRAPFRETPVFARSDDAHAANGTAPFLWLHVRHTAARLERSFVEDPSARGTIWSISAVVNVISMPQ